MRREFVEDGWRFRVTKREFHGGKVEVKVQFYDDSLASPTVDDVFSVTECSPREVRRSEPIEVFGYELPFTKTYTETYEVSEEELVETAMDRAWDRIEMIDQSPSEKFDEVVNEVRSDR